MMKSNALSLCTSVLASLSLFTASSGVVHAAETLTSNPFTLYFGYDNAGGNTPGWIEITGPNSTPTTQGDFTLSPVINSGKGSDYGFVFTNGSPTYYDAGPPTWGQYAFVAYTNNFELDLAASFTGTALGPNQQIRLVITKISIWGVAFDNQTSAEMAFQETTAGHTGESDPIDVKLFPVGAANLRPVNNYTLLEWNPDDFFSTGASQDRSFTLTPNRYVDGLTIEGYIEVTSIPEPSTALLGFMGGGALLLMAKRRFRNK